MTEETVQDVARRLVRQVWDDENLHGGLLSRHTISTAQELEHVLAREEKDGGDSRRTDD